MGATDVSPGQSTAQQMADYVKYLPQLMQTTAANLPDYEQALTNIRKTQAPQQAAIELDLLRKYAPEYNRIGSEIESQNTAASLQSQIKNLQNYGVPLALAAKDLEASYNPEWQALKQQLSGKLENYANQLDTSGRLTGGEIESINRGLAQQSAANGLLATPTNLNTIQNAMMFGNAAAARQQSQGQQLNNITQMMPLFKSNVDPFMVATGRASNLGTGLFNPNMANSVQGQGVAQNAFNQFGDNARLGTQILYQQNKENSPMAMMMASTEMFKNIAGGAGGMMMCWVAREVYGADDIRWLKFRNWVVNESPEWFYNTYAKYGKQIAKWISNKPTLKSLIRSWMNTKI